MRVQARHWPIVLIVVAVAATIVGAVMDWSPVIMIVAMLVAVVAAVAQVLVLRDQRRTPR
jgi:hypothetical protein